MTPTTLDSAPTHHEPDRVVLIADEEQFQNYFDATYGQTVEVLGPLSRINLLVGANNAGKSRLVRKIFAANNAELLPAEYDEKMCAIRDKLAKLEHAVGDGERIYAKFRDGGEFCDVEAIRKIRTQTVKGPRYWHPLLKNFHSHRKVPSSLADGPQIERVFQIFLLAFQGRAKPQYAITFRVDDEHEGEQVEVDPDLWILFNDLAALEPISTAPQKVYVPSHRTAASLFHSAKERESRDIFRTSVIQNYGLPTSNMHDVFTGLDLYERILRERGGTRKIRRRFEEFEKFLGATFFGGKTLDLVARYDENPTMKHVNVMVGDGTEREIHHLGDGIGSLIVLFYPVFMANPGSWIMIEEPELHLHPGFQRLFLCTLLGNEFLRRKNLRIFLTTHSNHLLGLAVSNPTDVSVLNLSAREQERFVIRCMQRPSLPVLDELGVESGSVFLANCTLWVEGPSDRILIDTYLRAYFQTYGGTYLEDIDYAFFMYGGSLLKWYLFADEQESTTAPGVSLERLRAQFVSNRVYLLCDMDNDPRKRARHEELRGLTSEHFQFRTTEPALEVENTISPGLLKEVLPTLRDNLREKDFTWLSKLPPEIRCTTRLGKLINDHGAYLPTETSGTLKSEDKLKLARAVRSLRPTWDQLGEVAQQLTKEIATFVRLHNPARTG